MDVDSKLADLYNTLKHTIWVIKVETWKKKEYATGFCVGGRLIMTKARGLVGAPVKVTGEGRSGKPSRVNVTARKLTEDGFVHNVVVIEMDRKFNLALLEVQGEEKDFTRGNLAADGYGSLSEGQSLFFIGHLDEFVGSFLIGRNVFRCPETNSDCVDILSDRTQTCAKYSLDKSHVTPDYRIMGQIYNLEKYQQLKSKGSGESKGASLEEASLRFAKELHPYTPIIQCNGFGFLSNDVSEGGPIFNRRGDVVGMLVSTVDNYQFAIHVSMLKSWLNKVQEEYNV